MPVFDRDSHFTVSLLSMGFPEFSVRTLVALWSGLDESGNGIAAGMASAEFFTARQAMDRGERRRYPIALLQNATADGFYNVTCANGQHFYDVRLEGLPPLRCEIRPAEWRALEYCVAIREGKTGAAERIQSFPELSRRLAGFSSSGPLKVPIGHIRVNQPQSEDEASISIETLRSALRKMGLRRPKHGQYA